jgi:hypothetical protein
MRKLGVLVVALSLTLFASCGGGGGTSPEQAAENSGEAFMSIVVYCLGDFGLEADANGYLVAKQAAQTCDCPGGGTATLSEDETTVTADDCRSANGYSFSGTLTIDDTGVVNGTLAPFGQCSSVTANNADFLSGECSGSITGTCEGETATCSITQGSGDECDINC